MKWQDTAETIKHNKPINLKDLANRIIHNKPLISYFLDGSRNVFKVDDIQYNKHIYPVVAGQIGVGCCKRVDKKMQPELFYLEFVIALPDEANADGWSDQTYFDSKRIKLNKSEELRKLRIEFTAILPYNTKEADSPFVNLENKAITRVQDFMIESEKRMVAELVHKNKLNQDNYLLKDGSLEYKIMKNGDESFRDLQNIKHNYNWVIGVSKRFKETCLDYTGRANADYIANLPLFHRTPVARYENSKFTGDVAFGVWYIRLREKKYTNTPFDGVIKVEKIMMDNELEYGIDSDVIDLISANLINERNPTCYGADKRWANHLYPVYLTETYLKSKFISAETFLHLF
jgi:hypothetical protein